MTKQSDVLVIAATAPELATADGWDSLACGVGPVEAAAATAAALARHRPAAVLHVGIAGARRRTGLVHGTLVLGTEARYADLSVGPEWAPAIVRPDATLWSAARQVLPAAVATPIGTSARIGGTMACDVEAMEGFAVLRAAALAGVPALEVRAISNDIEETDRARWGIREAIAAITAATPRLVEAIRACVR